MKSDSTVRNASLAGCVVKGTAARLVNDCSLNHSDEEMSDGAAPSGRGKAAQWRGRSTLAWGSLFRVSGLRVLLFRVSEHRHHQH